MPVTIEKTGKWDDFERELVAFADLGLAQVGIGVPDVKHEGKGGQPSLPDLVDMLEFGYTKYSVVYPPRPVFRPTMDANEAAYLDLVRDALKAFYKSGGSVATLKSELSELAQMMVDDVLDTIERQEFEGLAEATIQKKGHDMAWLETGQIMDSIQGVVKIEASVDGARRLRDALGRFVKLGD